LRKKPEQIGTDLAGQIKGDVHVDVFNRTAFSTDASIYQIFPQCVAAVRDEEDIQSVVRYARDNNLAIAARGAGSGVAGESLTDGIVLDIRRYMDRIVNTAPDGSIVTVQPGVVLDDLNAHLARFGRMIGPDPSSSNRAVVGGCLANNATGAHSLVYGHMDRFVERVRVILADGTAAELVNSVKPMEGDSRPECLLAGKCIQLLSGKEKVIDAAQPDTERNRSGYTIRGIVRDGSADLARLMAGSEGTLAIFTEITLRTVEIPKVKALIQLEFDSFDTMARAVPLIVRCGPAACELMDQTLMSMARQAYPKYNDVLPAFCAATLLVEMTGQSQSQVRDKLGAVRLAAADLAVRAEDVLDPRRQQRLWKARKDAVPLLNREKGPAHPIPFIEDVSVDPARLDVYIEGLERIGKKYNIPMAFYGHAGDGELHIRPYVDLSNAEGIRQMKAIAAEVFELAWSLGGSISGEHADGLVRAAFIRRQYGDEYYELLRGIKKIFDPQGILNPGKILNDDPDVMEKNLRLPGGGLPNGKSALLLGPDEFRFEAEQCSGCGVCLARAEGSRMCPVFRVMNEELATSRAKANLLRIMNRKPEEVGEFDRLQLRKILSLCVNCKMCSVQCPAGVDVSKLIIEARAQIARQTGFTVTELALSNNRRLSVLASFFAPLSNWILALPIMRWVMEKTFGFDRTRRFPNFRRGSFIRKAQRYLAAQQLGGTVDKVAYFVDSYANWNDHDLGFAVVKLLRELGIEVVVPRQRPAPLPAYVYGNIKTARSDLEYNLRQFAPLVRQGYKIICSEPSAALCLKEEMKYLIDSEDARITAGHTFELMDYLDHLSWQKVFDRMKQKPVEGNHRIAYHAPCHLQALRGDLVTVDLFRRLGMEVIDINGGCCGLAGTAGMQTKNRRMTDAIGGALKKKIEAINPDMILTECAACGMQIEHLTGRQVIHPVKMLARLFENEKDRASLICG
jgi:FAD/FMN-containing dehydrogenase/Fe-S oxidoreductase